MAERVVGTGSFGIVFQVRGVVVDLVVKHLNFYLSLLIEAFELF